MSSRIPSSRLFAFALLTVAISSGLPAQVSNFDTLNGYASGVETQVALSRHDLVGLDNSLIAATGIVASTGYLSREIDRGDDSFSREADGATGLIGYNWKKANWNFGIGVGGARIKTSYSEVNSPAPTPIHGTVEASTVQGRAWVGVEAGNFRMSVAGAIDNTSNDGTRVNDAGTSKANYDSEGGSFAVRISYEIPMNDAVSAQPFIGLSKATSDTDGFTEQGTAPDRRILQAFSVDESYGVAGVRVSGRQGNWIPHATVAWLEHLSGSDATIRSSAINGSNLGAGLSKSSSAGQFYFGAGISGTVERFRAGADLGYFTSDRENWFVLQVNAQYSF